MDLNLSSPGVTVPYVDSDTRCRNEIRTAVLRRLRDVMCEDEMFAATKPELLTALALVLTACNHKD
jgi:hypothetical protein